MLDTTYTPKFKYYNKNDSVNRQSKNFEMLTFLDHPEICKNKHHSDLILEQDKEVCVKSILPV